MKQNLVWSESYCYCQEWIYAEQGARPSNRHPFVSARWNIHCLQSTLEVGEKPQKFSGFSFLHSDLLYHHPHREALSTPLTQNTTPPFICNIHLHSICHCLESLVCLFTGLLFSPLRVGGVWGFATVFSSFRAHSGRCNKHELNEWMVLTHHSSQALAGIPYLYK